MSNRELILSLVENLKDEAIALRLAALRADPANADFMLWQADRRDEQIRDFAQSVN